jgi:hypothetical protein
MLDLLMSFSAGAVLAGSLTLYLAIHLLQRLIVFHLWELRRPAHTPPLNAEILLFVELFALALTTILMPVCLLASVLSLAAMAL